MMLMKMAAQHQQAGGNVSNINKTITPEQKLTFNALLRLVIDTYYLSDEHTCI